MPDSPLDVASLALFAFGALTFSALAALYWGTHRASKRGGSNVLASFTLVCAIAFLNTVAFQVSLISCLTAGLLPALIVHLVFEMELPRLPRSRRWRWLVMAFYAASIPLLLEWANETGLLAAPWAGAWYSAPAALLAAASAAGLVLTALARRPSEARERAHRRWTAVLLALMLACAAASWSGFGAAIGSLPDYLLLLFFSVTLYYRERLVFFDVVVKRGMYLAAGLALLAVWFPSLTHSPLILAAGFLVCWLTSPWIYARLARGIDRVWLRRKWTNEEAQRRFLGEIQIAGGEYELRERAAESLSTIFRGPAQVRFEGSALRGPADSAQDTVTAELNTSGSRLGDIRLGPRPNGMPYLSDDRRLLESLAHALAAILETVRLRDERRRQEERERELRWLAERAELKALRAQINPHFLFNTLSVIAGLLHYQPELADETIERLAQIFRYTLRRSASEWVPLGEEVEFVTAYLGIEQARFGDRLRLEFDVDPGVAHFQIPAMSIQPLIENAIKHGISAAEGAGSVGLRVAEQPGGALLVEVSDSGPGFPPGFSLESSGDGHGHGMRNVAERLRGYYGDRAQLFWESGRRTRVAFTIPPSGSSHFRGGNS